MTMARIAPPPAAQAALVVTGALTCIAAVVATSALAAAASWLCLALVILILWRGDDPPILFLPALFQWSEVAIWPISTIWSHLPLNDLSSFGADLEQPALYGLLGILAMSIGLRLGASRSKGEPLAVRLRSEAMRWSFRNVRRVAFSAMAAGYAFAVVSNLAGPARELFNQASTIKYVGLFMLAYWCLLHRRQSHVLVATILFEIGFGMTGFFAEFKNSALTLIVAALAARPRLRPRDILVVLMAGGLFLMVAIFWSAIKPDFRSFLNKGTGAQVQLVPMADRLEYLVNVAGKFDAAQFSDGFDRLLKRHGYVEFLGLVMANVPSAIPHEGGQLSLDVLQHIMMPRFIFFNKPPLPSDTEVMSKYTGLSYVWNEDTSISIGYLGELYIDFGFLGGLIAAGAIGWLVGFVYRTLRGLRTASALITAGLCLMAVLPIASFGTAYIKLIGSFVFASAISIVVQRYGLPMVLPFLIKRDAGASPASRRAASRG